MTTYKSKYKKRQQKPIFRADLKNRRRVNETFSKKELCCPVSMCQIPDHRWHIQRILGRLQSCLSTSSKWHYTVMRTAGKYNIDHTISRCWTSTAVAAHRFSSSIASIPWQTFNDLERTALRFLLRLCIDIPVKCSLRPRDSGKNCLSRLSRSSSDLKMDRNLATRQGCLWMLEARLQDYTLSLWGRSVLQLVS